jgi:hypothetical protein
MPGGDHYRCFLPDLAGFADPTSPGPDHQRRLSSSCCFDSMETSEMAERAGFEPAVPCDTHDFQSCTFVHSVTSPRPSQGARRGGCPSLHHWPEGQGFMLRSGAREGGEGGIRTRGRGNLQQISSLPPSSTRPPLRCLTTANRGDQGSPPNRARRFTARRSRKNCRSCSLHRSPSIPADTAKRWLRPEKLERSAKEPRNPPLGSGHP